MANNSLLYDAAFAGGSGGMFERWITKNQVGDYLSERNNLIRFASAVDLAIAPGAPGIPEAMLLQSVCQGVLAGRFLVGASSVSEIAVAIAALYTELLAGTVRPAFGSSQLINQSGVTGAAVTDALNALIAQIGTLDSGTTSAINTLIASINANAATAAAATASAAATAAAATAAAATASANAIAAAASAAAAATAAAAIIASNAQNGVTIIQATSGNFRREVYYANGTKDTITATGTVNSVANNWSLPADGSRFRVWLVPGGTGGGRGGRVAFGTLTVDHAGPSGPGGGAVAERWFARIDLERYITALGTPIPVVVGVGGLGGAALSQGSTAQNNLPGDRGTASGFGSLLAAYPGGKCNGPTPSGSISASGGSGGGWLSEGYDGQNSAASVGGLPVTNWQTSATMGDGTYGGGRGDTGNSTPDTGCSIWGGGGGGSGRGNGQNTNGGHSLFGVPGAGSGGSLDNNSPWSRNGGDGGKRGVGTTTGQPVLAGSNVIRLTGGGPVGGIGTGLNNNGGDGANGAPGVLGLYPGESGAGGGSCNGSGVNAFVTSGQGGDGGFPGGSGGSSGQCHPGNGTGSTAAAKRGGNGADGVVVVDTFG